MRNHLLLKLLGAFLLVTLIGTLLVYTIISWATRNEFDLYTTRSNQAWAEQLSADLADYYTANQSWDGVEAVLLSGLEAQPTPGMMGNGMGHGHMQGRQTTAGMMMQMGSRLILADANGLVINDTSGQKTGSRLSDQDLSNGIEIISDGQQVGTLIAVSANSSNALTLAGQFIRNVNRSILRAAAISAAAALIIGAILFVQITSPVRKLHKAANSIAAGDFEPRVDVHSQDDLGQLGNAFNLMAKSLEDSMLQRRMMVADVAHELRTPRTAMQGTLEAIKDGVLPMDDEQVNALYSETMLLNRLVGDLKLLSLADAGQLTLDKASTDVAYLIHQVVDRARTQAEQKNVQLETHIQPDLPEVELDPDRITQVMNNLIGNALRYTNPGGVITVSAALVGGRSLRVSVSDTGIGIPADQLPFIFDRFYRVDKSRTRVSGGSGLGLAIVKHLIEMHGGTIKAESPLGSDPTGRLYGTSISFVIPAEI